MEKYSLIKRIGFGRFGDVYEASVAESILKVALKLFDGHDIEKEVEILELFAGEGENHIIRILDNFSHEFSEVIVYEMMMCNLRELIDFNRDEEKKGRLNAEFTRYILWNMLLGVNELHTKNVIHCDLKPGNILLSSKSDVKISDLGTAMYRNEVDSSDIYCLTGNRVYSAPEVLLGSSRSEYAEARDIWAIGCIFAEFLSGKVLFRCNSATDLGQLNRILEICGSPDVETTALVTQYQNLNPSGTGGRELDIMFTNSISASELRILNDMLQLNPKKRPSSAELLRHEYFDAMVGPQIALKLPTKEYLDRKRDKEFPGGVELWRIKESMEVIADYLNTGNEDLLERIKALEAHE